MNVRNTFLTFIILLICFVEIFGQQISEFSSPVKEVLVGQPFDITLTITYPQEKQFVSLSFENIFQSKNKLYEKDTVNFEPYADVELLKNRDWPDFTLKKEFKLKPDPTTTSPKITNSFTLAIYNPGIFILPSPLLEGQSNDSSFLTIQVVVPPLDSLSQLKENDIYPIKTIEKEPANWSDYQFLIYGLILLFILYYFWKKAKNPNPPLNPDKQDSNVPSPAELAMKKLEQLEIYLSSDQLDLADFHEKISFIIREFLEKAQLIRALEMSTPETIHQFEQLLFADQEHIHKLTRILNYSDLVKFAKSLSQKELALLLLSDAKWLVLKAKRK